MQVYVREFGASLSTTDGGISLSGSSLDTTSPFENCRVPMPFAGTINKLTISVGTAVAASASKIFTLAVNGVNTALTGTIVAGGTSVVCTGGPITVAAGDLVHINYTHTGTPGSSSTATISFTFSSTTANGSIYQGQSSIGSATRFFQLFNPGNGSSTTSANDVMNVVAAPGIITGYYVSMAPGIGTSGTYTWTIFKNGVAQDGTGGTPDTRITSTVILGRNTVSTTFSLSVAASDLVYLQCAQSGASSRNCAYGIGFVATNAGESNLCWAFPSVPGSAGASSFKGPDVLYSTAFASEAVMQSICADKFKLTSMYMWLTAAPGGATSRTFTNRKNGGAGSFSVQLTTGATGNDTSHSDTYNPLDTICFNESAVSGSPAAATGAVGFVMYVSQGNPPGKGQQGNKKQGGGGVLLSTPGGTQLSFSNPGISTENN